MSEDFQSYLASTVLSDDRIVTFRVVSRALNVNSFHAKKMLFLFHQRENAKRAGSVHATYIVTGLRRFPAMSSQGDSADRAKSGEKEDVQMQSSSFPGSSMVQDEREVNQDIVKTMTLVREDRLEDLKALYAEVHSVSMYSIQSGPLKNLDLITSVYEQLHQDSQNLDPLESIKAYGSIQNPYVKRRTSHRLPPPPRDQEGTSMSKASAKAMFMKSSDTKNFSDGDSKQSLKSKSDRDADGKSQSSQPASSSVSRPPPIKRESSSIFKSFAKAKASKSKAEVSKISGPTDSSASGAHSMPIGDLSTRGDVKLQEDVDMEDDEGDGDSQFVENSVSSARPPKSKAERDAELHKKIFDDDDDDGDGDGDDADDDDDKSGNKDKDSAEASQQDQVNDKEMPDAPDDSHNQDAGVEDDDDDKGMDETSNDCESAEEVAKDAESSQEGGKVGDAGQSAGSGDGNVAAGRRRGRRRVVRKRMIKDADGYLVTKEEPGWESFSEDETTSPLSALASKSTGQGQLRSTGKSSSATPPSSSATSGSKKGSSQASGAAKKGQGNIMSFFGKK